MTLHCLSLSKCPTGSMAFSVMAPQLWNISLLDLRTVSSLEIFHAGLTNFILVGICSLMINCSSDPLFMPTLLLFFFCTVLWFTIYCSFYCVLTFLLPFDHFIIHYIFTDVNAVQYTVLLFLAAFIATAFY